MCSRVYSKSSAQLCQVCIPKMLRHVSHRSAAHAKPLMLLRSTGTGVLVAGTKCGALHAFELGLGLG